MEVVGVLGLSLGRPVSCPYTRTMYPEEFFTTRLLDVESHQAPSFLLLQTDGSRESRG